MATIDLIQAVLWPAEWLAALTTGTPNPRREPRVVTVPVPPAFRKERAAEWLEDAEQRSLTSLQWEFDALSDYQATLRLAWQRDLHMPNDTADFMAWMCKIDRRRRWLEGHSRRKRAAARWKQAS